MGTTHQMIATEAFINGKKQHFLWCLSTHSKFITNMFLQILGKITIAVKII